MWNKELIACARAYPSGILTAVDQSGYPFSIRCEAIFSEDRETITFKGAPPSTAGMRGMACLLFHRHREDLGDQHELMIKGELSDEDGALTFRPTGFLTGSGSDNTNRMPVSATMLERIQFMRLGQRKAREYIKKRREPWPSRPRK